MACILNNLLSWDGTYLGQYNKESLMMSWTTEGSKYYMINLPQGWSDTFPSGKIYCMMSRTKDLFPCIVEDIKQIFNIPRRGIHRIKIGNYDYIIYYVPITIRGELIWETPLNRLDSKHFLRKNPEFRRAIQKIIAFCEILALNSTSESTIRIRLGSNGMPLPINVNETNTSIKKETNYDYSIITKTLFTKWFGEETSICDIVNEMVKYQTNDNIQQNDEINLRLISSSVRTKVEKIIKRYDSNYIWYTNFIVDRLSRQLLNVD